MEAKNVLVLAQRCWSRRAPVSLVFAKKEYVNTGINNKVHCQVEREVGSVYDTHAGTSAIETSAQCIEQCSARGVVE